MATKDISRFLHQPPKHYAAVRLEQGRVLLDSDFSEGARLPEEERRQALLAAIGPYGSPDDGFTFGIIDFDIQNPPDEVRPLAVGSTLSNTNAQLETPVPMFLFAIRAGTMYVGGMRFVLEKAESIEFQSDFLQLKDQLQVPLEGSSGFVLENAEAIPFQGNISLLDRPLLGQPLQIAQPEPGVFRRQLYYLRAWEQCVTSVEDSEFLERALGGPDTTVRIRRMRRVEAVQISEEDFIDCSGVFEREIEKLGEGNAEFVPATGELRSKGLLQIAFQRAADDDPCTPDPPSQYLGTENQTIKIMLSQSDRFVWAIDNGAPLYRVRVTGLSGRSPEGIQVEMLTLPRDEEHHPKTNRVVEFLPFAALIDGVAARPENASANAHFKKAADETGVLCVVDKSYDPDSNIFTLNAGVNIDALRALVHTWDNHPKHDQLTPEASGTDERFFYARMWHVTDDASQVDLPLNADPDGPTLGRTGIVPIFHHAGMPGDFWTATFRTATRDRVVPFDLANEGGVPPHGPHHFFAPLALLEVSGFGLVTRIRDLRPRMRKLIDQVCCTITVGDGLCSKGDFTKIQDAIDALPEAGGRVCVRPGTYREDIVIRRRHDIVLEGCGESTIIETPDPSELSGLIAVDDSDRITVKAFTLRATQEPAVFASDVRDLALAELAIVAGTGDGIATDTSNALVGIQDGSERVSLRAIAMDPAGRPALFVDESDEVSLDRLVLRGGSEGMAPVFPLVIIQNSTHCLLQNSTLTAFGQVAVKLQGDSTRDLRVSEVSIFSDHHVSGGEQIRTAIDVDGGRRIVVESCEIQFGPSASDHAAIVLKGRDIDVEENVVEVVPACIARDVDNECIAFQPIGWGGIQVRGTSSNVRIARNKINGGLGHGITLGSVLWQHPPLVPRFEGAGRVQTKPQGILKVVNGNLGAGFDEPTGTHFTPVDEGALTNVVIADNHISGMSTNGISILTVLGLQLDEEDATDLMEIEGLAIERNTISGNVVFPCEDVTVRTDVLPFPGAQTPGTAQPAGIPLPILPFGGIVLGVVSSGATIRNNVIVDNNTSATLPMNGIFVLAGDAIDISGNRIAGNGAQADGGEDNENNLALGIRAGIAVMLAGAGMLAATTDIDETLEVDSPTEEVKTLDTGRFSLRVHKNSVQQPEGRALYSVVTGPTSIDHNFFSSRGNHGADVTADEFAVGDVVFVQNLGSPWEVVDIDRVPTDTSNPSQFRDFTTPFGTHQYLLNSVAVSPRLLLGAGGGVLFTNNQVIYDWEVALQPHLSPPAPLSFFSVVVLSLDHVTLVSNQFALRLTGITPTTPPPVTGFTQPLLAQVLAGGGTVQAAYNRASEPVTTMPVSIITGGEMLNVTAFNQGTHFTVAYKWNRELAANQQLEPTLFSDSNLAMFVPKGTDVFTNLRGALKTPVRRFFQLLHEH